MEHFVPIDVETPDKPEVFRTAKLLQVSQGDAFLAWFRIWSYWRTHSTNGEIRGVDDGDIDRIAQLPGFSGAAVQCGWLQKTDDGYLQPRFDYHLHGCESLKKYKHANRARKSRDNAALRDELLSRLPADLAAQVTTLLTAKDVSAAEVSSTAHGTVREKRTPGAHKEKPEREREIEIKPDRSGPAGRVWENFVLSRGKPGGMLHSLWSAEPLEPNRHGGQLGAMLCFREPHWSDDWIKRWLVGTPEERNGARSRLFVWYRRQLSADDPVVPERSPAAAAIVIALAESIATEKGAFQSRVGLFRKALQRGDLERIAPEALKKACKFVADEIGLKFAVTGSGGSAVTD